jgi:hypothetical protein
MKLSFILSLALTASLLVGCSDSDSPDINDEIAQPDGSTPSDDTQQDELPAAYVAIMTDQLIEADYWQEEPAILAAGLGFTDINGIPDLAKLWTRWSSSCVNTVGAGMT